MASRATVLRSEAPSIIKLTSGQQPKGHADQLVRRRHQRPLVRVMGGRGSSRPTVTLLK